MSSLKYRALVALFTWFGRVSPATRLRLGAILTWFTMAVARPRRRNEKKKKEQ
jgi:KDO2-lipid IV(A) lauroyltransferase